jgi:hypothetical protein
VGKVQEVHKAGMVQIKLAINDLQQNPNLKFKELDAWNKKVPKQVPAYKVRCYIFQSKNLPSADKNSQSDPYFDIFNPEREDKKEGVRRHDGRSRTIKDNQNPIFLETHDVDMLFHNKEEAAPIVIDLFDEDNGVIDNSDDFLGRVLIPLSDSSVADFTQGLGDHNIPPRPKWHDLRTGTTQDYPVCG